MYEALCWIFLELIAIVEKNNNETFQEDLFRHKRTKENSVMFIPDFVRIVFICAYCKC